MAVFAYKALDPGSAPVRGILVADTPRQARDSLRAKGLTIEELVPHSGGPAGRARPSRRQAARVAPFIRELAMLLGAGIPLLDAIDTLARQHDGARPKGRGRPARRDDFRAALALLRDRISAGASLADAMREQPALFDDMSVSVTEVGEHSGSLEEVLTRLAEFKERSLRLKNRVLTALAYPSFVLVMALAVAVGLMTFVIPKLLDSLAESGQPLPWATRVVKAASDFLVYRWWLLLGIFAAVVVSVGAVLRTPAGRLRWHRLQLRLPVVGTMVRKQAIARAAVVIATMMKSGIVFLKALNIAQKGTPNLALRQALGRCESAVGAGQEIGSALESTGLFPLVVVQIFSVGQQSGRLEEMLERLAAEYDTQVAMASDRLTAILEPLLVLLLVGLVALIAFATILPLLEAADVV